MVVHWKFKKDTLGGTKVIKIMINTLWDAFKERYSRIWGYEKLSDNIVAIHFIMISSPAAFAGSCGVPRDPLMRVRGSYWLTFKQLSVPSKFQLFWYAGATLKSWAGDSFTDMITCKKS